MPPTSPTPSPSGVNGLWLVLISGGVTASFAGDEGALPSNGAAGYVG